MNKDLINLVDIAIKEADKASKNDAVPIGCVIANANGKIISQAHNRNVKNNLSAINHAEFIAIKKAYKKLNSASLKQCLMVVTLKPCVVCMGLIMSADIETVYYLLNSNDKFVYDNFFVNNLSKPKIIQMKISSSKYKRKLISFFQKKR